MSVDLAIFPLKNRDQLSEKDVCIYNCLRFETDYSINCQIHEIDGYENKPVIRPKKIPLKMLVHIYEDEGIFSTREDCYGDELTFAYAKEFRKVKFSNHTSPFNRAIKAFIDALPDDTPIILYWC